MSTARKPREAAAKKPAAKAAKPKLSVVKTAKPRVSFADTEAKHPIGQALQKALKAFGGSQRALAAYLGIQYQNLNRALRMSKAFDEGRGERINLDVKYLLPLAKVSGVPLNSMAPDIYEPHMKTKRVKVVEGKVQA